MEKTIGKASLQDAAIRTGIVVDKMFALTGQPPVLQTANIVLPTVEKALGKKLQRKITLRLLVNGPPHNSHPTAIQNSFEGVSPAELLASGETATSLT
jgi:hypothetical protein